MNRRKLYDVTVPIRSNMPTWPGDPGFERSIVHAIAEGASSDVSMLRMGSHTGTHVDAPAHFLPGGATVDQLALDVLVGPAAVFELTIENEITQADLEALDFEGCERALFKTRNSRLWERDEFTTDFVYFTPDAARLLVEKGVRLVGIDYLSVAEYKHGTDVHRILLQHGVVIVEGLDLSKIEAGAYQVMCLPLKVLGAEGAPARVLLAKP
ncbi:MAG: cyclase family protein [Candidatus Aquicultor sp.]